MVPSVAVNAFSPPVPRATKLDVYALDRFRYEYQI